MSEGYEHDDATAISADIDGDGLVDVVFFDTDGDGVADHVAVPGYDPGETDTAPGSDEEPGSYDQPGSYEQPQGYDGGAGTDMYVNDNIDTAVSGNAEAGYINLGDGQSVSWG